MNEIDRLNYELLEVKLERNLQQNKRIAAEKQLALLELNSINELIEAAHENAINKGWYAEPKSFGDSIALMHSELSEALEDYRKGLEITEVYYEGEKPCGIPTELADVVIRIFDTCGHYDIDLELAIKEKMAYNATRPVRHGGKKL